MEDQRKDKYQEEEKKSGYAYNQDSQHSAGEISTTSSLKSPRVYYHNLNARDSLPVLVPENYKFGIWSILKSVIGKDITKIAVPV